MHEIQGDRAVVLGASMAGLLAARVLAEAYAEVAVVERDELPDGASHRRGVPQSRHIHGLLARGQLALEELFSGLTEELTAAGAPAGDMLQDVRVFLGGHHLRPGQSGLMALQASRPLLEACVRARVRALQSVHFMPPCDVTGLTTTADGTRVTGVRVVPRRDGSAEQTVTADLVVDATGRGSRTPAWLEMLGYRRPPIETVHIGIGYASRTYRLDPALLAGTLGIIISPTPDHPRGGGLAVMEGGRFIVTLFGILDDHPPTDPAGFTGFGETLPFPDISSVLRDAEPLDDPVPFRHPVSVRHHYERLASTPEGLLVIGDAACTFNPVYGQGMTVAALEALALRAHLRRHSSTQPARFFREIARIADVPWSMATSGDLAFPGVVGRHTTQMRVLNGYVARVHAAAEQDAALGRAFMRVAGLVDPPRALFTPAVAARVLSRPGGARRFLRRGAGTRRRARPWRGRWPAPRSWAPPARSPASRRPR